MSDYRRIKIAGGMFFFTVNLANRNSNLLIDEITCLREAYRRTTDLYPFETIAICVLPEHIHTIWKLPKNDVDYSKRWRVIKSNFSRNFSVDNKRSNSKFKKREKGIWQRRFWEHLIRDQTDLNRHIDYIHYNPVKHGLVKRVQDWEYSSFHKYVENGKLDRNWGSLVDEGKFGE